MQEWTVLDVMREIFRGVFEIFGKMMEDSGVIRVLMITAIPLFFIAILSALVNRLIIDDRRQYHQREDVERLKELMEEEEEEEEEIDLNEQQLQRIRRG